MSTSTHPADISELTYQTEARLESAVTTFVSCGWRESLRAGEAGEWHSVRMFHGHTGRWVVLSFEARQ